MLEDVVENKAEEEDVEKLNGRECDRYRCGKEDGADWLIGKGNVGWSEIELQSCDENDDELLECWSEEGARGW